MRKIKSWSLWFRVQNSCKQKLHEEPYRLCEGGRTRAFQQHILSTPSCLTYAVLTYVCVLFSRPKAGEILSFQMKNNLISFSLAWIWLQWKFCTVVELWALIKLLLPPCQAPDVHSGGRWVRLPCHPMCRWRTLGYQSTLPTSWDLLSHHGPTCVGLPLEHFLASIKRMENTTSSS